MIPYPGDIEYAATRLDDTVVMYGQTPVEVKRVIGSRRRGFDGEDVGQYYDAAGIPKPRVPIVDPVWIQDLLTGRQNIVPIAEIDPTPVELGYVNHGGHASYLVRVPKRDDWRQGMRYNNIRTTCGLAAQRVPYSAIARTIVGDFPKFKDVIKKIQGRLTSIAWHRDWAMYKDGTVHYQGDRVGKLIEDRIALDQDYQYLQEALDESYET